MFPNGLGFLVGVFNLTDTSLHKDIEH
jgi:hypothetical protein